MTPDGARPSWPHKARWPLPAYSHAVIELLAAPYASIARRKGTPQVPIQALPWLCASSACETSVTLWAKAAAHVVMHVRTRGILHLVLAAADACCTRLLVIRTRPTVILVHGALLSPYALTFARGHGCTRVQRQGEAARP